MHILEVTSWYKQSKTEIYAPFVEEHARMLLKRGHKVAVMHPHLNGGFLERIKGGKNNISFEIDDSLPTYRIGIMSNVPKIQKLIYNYVYKQTIPIFEAYVKENNMPDILHAHSTLLGGYIAMKLKENYGVPFVISKHSTPFLFFKAKQTKADISILKDVANNSNAIIFVSKFARDEYSRLYNLQNEKKLVINNPVNDLFFEDYEENRISKRIVSIGGLRKVKNFELLIAAFYILHKKYPDIMLDIYGEGPLRNTLQDKINTLALSNNIILHGNKSRKEIKNAIDKSLFLVSSSKLETFGINLIEAMACGKPVVATDSGGPRDIINADIGFLVKKHETSILAEKMIEMYEHLNNYNNHLIQQFCKENFSEEKICNQTISIYNNILHA